MEKRLEQQREKSLVQPTELMMALSLVCSRDEQTEIQMGSMTEMDLVPQRAKS